MKTLKIIIIFSVINFGILTGIVLGNAKNLENVQIGSDDTVSQELPVPFESTEPVKLAETTKSEKPNNEVAKPTKPVTQPQATVNTAPPKKTEPSPAPTPAPTPKPQNCIITIDGVSYDVTAFRKIHSGGDIFKCGTDMTAVFYSQHSSQTLKAMQKYRL